MGRGGGRSGGGSSHSSSRGVTSGRGGGSRSMGSGTRRAGGSPGRTGSFGSFGGTGHSRPPRGGYGGPRPAPRRAWFGGYRSGPVYGRPVYGGGYGMSGGGCGGCLAVLVTALIVIALLGVLAPAACTTSMFSFPSQSMSSNSGSSSAQVAQVTHTHEKLAASECDESDEWLDDQAGWIDSKNTVVSALRYFYDKTGSQPFLVIATNVNGKTDFTDDEAEDWVNDIYDEHFSDDGHTVVAFVEYSESEYAYYIVAGRSAQSVIDEEAREIIADEINYWYTDSNLDDSEYFAKVFTESADTIMFDYEETTKTSNSRKRTIAIAVGAAGAVAVIGYVIARTSKRKKEEYEEARKLAETPVGSASSGTSTSSSTSSSSSTYSTVDAPSTEDGDSSTMSELEEFERKYGSD